LTFDPGSTRSGSINWASSLALASAIYILRSPSIRVPFEYTQLPAA
jgi:hypothetical protein